MLEGEGAIHAAGARASRPIVVEITDETGRPVEGAAVSFRMPEEGPGASFPQNMKTDIRVTTPDGRALCHDFTVGGLSGPFQVRVTAVKSQIRAGVVVGQYVSDGPVKAAGARRSSRKWLVIAAVAAAAATGATVSVLGGAREEVARAPAAVVPPPTIGAPSISVGGPQ